MFDFIRRWAFNRSRFIFSYWDGSRIAKADPMVLWRSLQQHADFSEADFRLMKVDALRDSLVHKLANVVRDVFNIKLPDAGGLTELETLEILRSFIEYTGFQKKSGEPTQTSPQLVADTSEDWTAGGNTNDSSDSTSTATE